MAGGAGWGGICLLGEVQLLGADGPVVSRSAFARTMLALLALRPGELVRTSTLIDELWGEQLPADPKGALQIQATRLRKWLAAAGDGAPALRNEHDGYRLDVPAEQVDLARFLAAAAAALAEGAEPTEVVGRADEALATFAGEPFTGCALALRLNSERVRADELRLQVVERRAEALLDQGEAKAVIADLTPVVAEHRAREELTALLMVALYRSGRQQEALIAFEETRRHLVEEFGLEPGVELVELQHRVLEQDPGLRPRGRPRRSSSNAPVRSRPVVVERNDMLAALRPGVGGAGRIVVLAGEAGIGKTTVLAAAVHDAAAEGAIVGSGSWDDSGAPLAGWDEVMDEIGLPPLSAGRLEHGSTAGRAVRALLASAALDAPVLVALDDLHLADSMSLGILRGLARLGLPPGVIIAVAAREPDAIPRPLWVAALADLLRSPSVEQRQLRHLTPPGVADVVAASLAGVAVEERQQLSELLWHQTAGHPLHLGAILGSLSGLPDETARRTAVATVPDRLQPLLAHQLQALPGAARDLLEVLAVLGPAALEDLARLGPGADALEAARSLRPALDQGVLREDDGMLSFRHALVGIAVLDRTPVAVATRLHHARYAELVRDGGEPFEVLRHAIGASSLVTLTQRATAQLAAGRAAYARGAHEEADGLFRAALGQADDVAGVQLGLGLNLAALGRREEADVVLGALAADGELATEIRITAAVGHEPLGLSVAGDPARLERLRAVLPVADAAGPAARLDLLRALVIEESLAEGDPTPGLQSRLDQLATDLDATEGIDPVTVAHLRMLAARADVEAPIPAAARVASAEVALTAATASRDPVLRLQAIEFVLSAVLAAGQLERTEDLRWLLQREAAQASRPRSVWAASIVEASTLVAQGRSAEADVIADQALERGLELGIPDAFGAYGVYLAARHLLAGTLDTIAPLVEQSVAAYLHIAAWPAAAAVAAVHAGDLDAAGTALAEFARRRAAHATRYFDRTALCLAARAAAATGDADVARVVEASLPADPDAIVVVGVGAGVFGPANLYVGLAEATLGDFVAARVHFDDALALARRLGWTPWEAVAATEIAALPG
jgi:DNA-binding SARP family transcriptional activator/tetratricopeptide (TPR) repeat protein